MVRRMVGQRQTWYWTGSWEFSIQVSGQQEKRMPHLAWLECLRPQSQPPVTHSNIAPPPKSDFLWTFGTIFIQITTTKFWLLCGKSVTSSTYQTSPVTVSVIVSINSSHWDSLFLSFLVQFCHQLAKCNSWIFVSPPVLGSFTFWDLIKIYSYINPVSDNMSHALLNTTEKSW